MKEAIGGSWLFQIVIVMVLLFSGFLAISLNYSRAFQVKNGVLNIVQRHNGLNRYSRDAIWSYMDLVGYRNSGQCVKHPAETEWAGVTTNGKWVISNSPNSGGQRFFVCIYRTRAQPNQMTTLTQQQQGIPDSYLYRVEAHFRLDVPVIANVFNLRTSGTTRVLLWPDWDIVG